MGGKEEISFFLFPNLFLSLLIHQASFRLSSTSSSSSLTRETIQLVLQILQTMADKISEPVSIPPEAPVAETAAPISHCRKKKSDDATFFEGVKSHYDDFMSSSMDEHKTCFKKTMEKMFGWSKMVAEKNAASAAVKDAETSLPIQTQSAELKG